MIFISAVLELFEELLLQRLDRLNWHDPHDRLTEDEIQDSLDYALVTKGNVADLVLHVTLPFPGWTRRQKKEGGAGSRPLP